MLALLEDTAKHATENSENIKHTQHLKRVLGKSEQRMQAVVDLIEELFAQHLPDPAADEPELSRSEFHWKAKSAWMRHEGKIKRFLAELREDNRYIIAAIFSLTV